MDGLALVHVGDPLHAGEEVQDLLVHALELAPGDGDADQGRGEALGHRLQGVEPVGLPAVEVFLDDQAAVADDEQAVEPRVELALPDERPRARPVSASRPCSSGVETGHSQDGGRLGPGRLLRPERRRPSDDESQKQNASRAMVFMASI